MELTTIEAAKEFGLHPNGITRLASIGRIKGRKDRSGRWLVDRVSLQSYIGRVRRKTQAPETGIGTALRILNGQKTHPRKETK